MGRTPARRSSTRSAGRPPAARRGAGATARPRGRANPRPLRIGWSRRLGIVAALLIGGASVALASQALGPGPGGPGLPRPGSSGVAAHTATAALAAAPELDPPASTLTREPRMTLEGRVADDLPRDGSHRLRIYVNGQLERDRRLPRRERFSIEVPLAEGVNTVTAAINAPGGESLHSAPVEVTRDSTPPALADLEPASGTTIYADSVTVRGRSEPGASLRVSSRTNGQSTLVEVGPDGSFELQLPLLLGFNEIALEARDAAGNEATASLTLERRQGEPSVGLSLSRTAIDVDALPASVALRADVRDAAVGAHPGQRRAGRRAGNGDGHPARWHDADREHLLHHRRVGGGRRAPPAVSRCRPARAIAPAAAQAGRRTARRAAVGRQRPSTRAARRR
jgi:hypothetical protein